MDADSQEPAGGSDAELITRVRAGDRGAFGTLYSRHAAAAANLARQFTRTPAEVDDLVSESFARVLDALLAGRGPDTAFRAYLFTTLRNTAVDRGRKDSRLQFTDDLTSHETPQAEDDPVVAQLENTMVARAFAALPERWQTVLWHTQVEGQSPAEVGVLLGMSANAVTSLAFRAREGLREAYLQAHLADTAAERCRATVDRLGGWARGGLSKREQAQVDAHLAECDRCRALAAELAEINTGLRGLLAPLLLGGAAAGYLATTGTGVAIPLVAAGGAAGAGAVGAGAAGTAVAGGAAAGSGSSGGGVLSFLARPWTLATAGAGVAAAVVAVIVVAVMGSGHREPLAGGPPPVTPVATSSVTSAATSVVTSVAGTPSPATSLPAVTSATTPTTAVTTPGPPTPVAVNSSPAQPVVVRTTVGTPTSAPAASTPPVTSPSPSPPVTTSPAAPVSTPVPSPPVTTPAPSSSAPPPAHLSAPSFAQAAAPLTAGAPAAVPFSVTNSGGTDSPPQTLIVSTPPGVTLAGGSSDVTPAAQPLRRFSAAFARPAVTAAPATATSSTASPTAVPLICGPDRCTYTVPAHSTVTVTLQLVVSPSAAAGEITVLVPGSAPISIPATVAPGLTALALGGPATTWDAGQTAAGVPLTATIAPGVTDPGTITLPLRDGDLWFTGYPDTCTPAAAGIVCRPASADAGTAEFGTFTVTLLPAASGDQHIPVGFPGGRTGEVLGAGGVPVTVAALRPGGPVALTGPFGGELVGAPMMQCQQPITAKDRTDCAMRMLDGTSEHPFAVRTIDVPAGATVLSATLYWAATSADAGQSLDSITLHVDGGAYPVTGAATPGEPDSPGILVTRAADVTALLAGGSQSVFASGLPASLGPSSQGHLPMAAWSLAVVWSAPDDTHATVALADPGALSDPGSGATTTVASAGTRMDRVQADLWGVDPWGVKSLSLVPTGPLPPAPPAGPLPTQIRGTCPDGGPGSTKLVACGFQFLDLSGTDLAGSAGAALVLTNRAGTDGRADALWLGPTLVLREAQ